jgi:hypothetical protein
MRKPGLCAIRASRLIANDGIKARIAELQNASAKRAEITLDSLLADMERIQQAAEAAGQNAAAVSAAKLKAELAGHYVQRKEAKVEAAQLISPLPGAWMGAARASAVAYCANHSSVSVITSGSMAKGATILAGTK